MFKSFFQKLNPFLRFAAENKTSVPSIPDTYPLRKSSAELSSPGWTWNMVESIFDGEKYPGGLNSGFDFFYIDYWTLRRRSYRLFTENRYASGLIRRMLRNEIHTGLILEATPKDKILTDFTVDDLNKWADEVETKFDIWANNKKLVSYNEKRTFGQIQWDIRKTALLSGDVLIVLRQHADTKTPVIQLIDGYNVRTPLDYSEKDTGNQIREGVEIDSRGRDVAFWVEDASDFTGVKSKRIPAFGARTGRKIAWMVYGHKIRVNDVRGMPALGIILQSLKELDRYSDAEQRAAALNAILAIWVNKTQDRLGTKSFTGRAQRYDAVGEDTSGSETTTRQFNIARQYPGVVLDELAYGEEPKSFSAARPNVNYKAFEEAMMASFAWANEMPPNIYRLAFSSNYSASGAEINEYKIYLDGFRADFASDVAKPVYQDWLLSMSLIDQVNARGLLEAWRDKTKFLEWGAWVSSEWGGMIKPSLRLIQEVKAYIAAKKEGLITYDMITKFLWGKKFTTIIRRLKHENNEYIEAVKPLIEAGLISVGETGSESSASSANAENLLTLKGKDDQVLAS